MDIEKKSLKSLTFYFKIGCVLVRIAVAIQLTSVGKAKVWRKNQFIYNTVIHICIQICFFCLSHRFSERNINKWEKGRASNSCPLITVNKL